MIKIETLGEIRRHEFIITANCTGFACGRGRPLDIDRLIEIFGEDYSVIEDTRIRAALVCIRCKHRGGSLSVTPLHTGPT